MCTLAPGYTMSGPICWDAKAPGVNSDTTRRVVPGWIADGTNLVSQYRLVAGCIKVHYVGTELNRSGMVYTGYTNTNPWRDTTGLGVTISNVANHVGVKMCRLGTEQHEARWVPDAESSFFIGKNKGDSSWEETQGSTLSVAVLGAPVDSIQYEVVCVWEWVPDPNQVGGGIVATPQAPKSANTLNEVLRTIGPVAEFVAGKAIGAAGNYALAALKTAVGMTDTVPMYRGSSSSVKSIGWH